VEEHDVAEIEELSEPVGGFLYETGPFTGRDPSPGYLCQEIKARLFQESRHGLFREEVDVIWYGGTPVFPCGTCLHTSYIGCGQYHVSFRLQNPLHLEKEAPRVGNVLYEMGEMNRIEETVRKGCLIECADEDVETKGSHTVLCRFPTDLYTTTVPPLLLHVIEKQTGGAADVEEPSISIPALKESIESDIFETEFHEVEEIVLVGDLILEVVVAVSLLQIPEHGPRVLVHETAHPAALIGKSFECQEWFGVIGFANVAANEFQFFGHCPITLLRCF